MNRKLVAITGAALILEQDCINVLIEPDHEA